MEIKRSLKTLDIKISKLASELGISRPTLDTYIDYFEKDIPIPNKEYQEIFKYLFSNQDINSVEFAKKYDYVKRVMLKNVESGAEKVLIEKREDMLLEKLREIENLGVDKPLLEFINLFLDNNNDSLVKAIYMYFNYTNGIEDINKSEISELDKSLYSQMCKLFEDYKSGNVEFLEQKYNQMLEKCEAKFNKKKLVVSDEDIIEYIKNNIKDSSSLDMDYLRKMIELRGDK